MIGKGVALAGMLCVLPVFAHTGNTGKWAPSLTGAARQWCLHGRY
ncbi:Uncharacterised protein [Citrobacter freundii]|nr:Uncharacterised protein [Citrobacter freundii]